jgi:hypothetical protein
VSVRDVIAAAIQPLPQQHGQLCPVWTRKAELADCDCWIKPGVYAKAGRAVSHLREAGYLRPDVETE